MIVVADTSPINYLVLIGRVDLLGRLYRRILIPSAVLAELKHAEAPNAVRKWANDAPSWLAVLNPKTTLRLNQLDPGKSEAITLAIEVHAEVVLIDDHDGRQEALRRGLKVAGTLAILDDADRAGLIVFDDAVAALRQTSFRLSPLVLKEIRKKRSR